VEDPETCHDHMWEALDEREDGDILYVDCTCMICGVTTTLEFDNA